MTRSNLFTLTVLEWVKQYYTHHHLAKETQCLTQRVFLFPVILRFSRAVAWWGKTGHQWQHYKVLVTGMCTFPVHMSLASAVCNLFSCPSSFNAQLPYWDVFNTSIGKHFSKVRAELHGSSTPGNFKIFYQRLYYKWRLVANPNAKPATVTLFLRRDCPAEFESDSITASIIHFN